MEASAEGGGVPWAKEGMFQTREWIPFLGPEDMPSLCAVDKAGLLYAMEIMQRVGKHCYDALENEGRKEDSRGGQTLGRSWATVRRARMENAQKLKPRTTQIKLSSRFLSSGGKSTPTC